MDHRGMIKKATLTFAARFFYLLDRHRLSPTQADNVVTWYMAILVAFLVAGLVSRSESRFQTRPTLLTLRGRKQDYLPHSYFV